MNSSSSNSQNHRMPFIPGEPVYDPERILIFLITPTYTRPTQAADMTRLSQTLQLVPDIFWIVVEDAHNRSRYAIILLCECMWVLLFFFLILFLTQEC